ncbi:MAG: hypothetical protein JAZ17_11035 [Candidatus Thiodiazotropha endolucinida]|nr:hypothetical protein [Candidatus Thiodiazotropha endolucinida]
MSDRTLSQDEISILSRGLKFTPTPEKQNIEEMQNDMAEFHRKIRLKEYFFENEYEQDDSLVRNKSSFQPPKGRNSALDQFISTNKEFPSSTLSTSRKANISLKERKCIENLKNDPSIIIKEADKGGGVVIMNKEYYERKMLDMLNDKAFYQTTDNDCSKTTFKRIKALIKENKDITRHEFNYLLEFEWKSSSFYGLPKIHKSKLIKEQCQKTTTNVLELKDPSDLKFRPIVAGPVCETHRLSNLIDILLKPFIKNVKSYIRDDIDFLSHLPRKIDKNAMLVSFDVTNLYTNISHSLGLEAIEYWLNKYPNLIHKRFSKSFILEGIKTILENNNFKFDEKYYNQIKGTAMGTKCAPTYATLVLGYLEEKLYAKMSDTNEELANFIQEEWKRFLDDCFIIWTRSDDELTQFYQTLNNLHKDINFTIEKHKNKLPFLDVMIIKKNDTLSTDIFYKETDSKQYLNFTSCHPSHTKRSIPYNLARRICTIVSESEVRETRLKELTALLICRGYPKQLIQNGIENASKIPRHELLTAKPKEETDIITYVSTYNPKNPEAFGIIKNNIPILMNDDTMRNALKETNFIKSKRQPPNLKRLLTKANFTSTTLSERHTFRVTKCGRNNCSLCQHIIESDSYNFKRKKFFVNSNMSCDVQNVLYVITCNGCGEFYIGQTGGKLRTRRTIHAQQIRDPSTRMIPLSAHLDECCHTEPKFQMFPFFKMSNDSTSARLNKENYFIKCFKPKLNALHA